MWVDARAPFEQVAQVALAEDLPEFLTVPALQLLE